MKIDFIRVENSAYVHLLVASHLNILCSRFNTQTYVVYAIGLEAIRIGSSFFIPKEPKAIDRKVDMILYGIGGGALFLLKRQCEGAVILGVTLAIPYSVSFINSYKEEAGQWLLMHLIYWVGIHTFPTYSGTDRFSFARICYSMKMVDSLVSYYFSLYHLGWVRLGYGAAASLATHQWIWLQAGFFTVASDLVHRKLFGTIVDRVEKEEAFLYKSAFRVLSSQGKSYGSLEELFGLRERWRDNPRQAIEKRYRALAGTHHPDKGGTGFEIVEEVKKYLLLKHTKNLFDALRYLQKSPYCESSNSESRMAELINKWIFGRARPCLGNC